VLAGHSLGALVTLTVGHLFPAHVRALIANDPPLLGDDLNLVDYPDAQAWFTWVYETVKDQPSFEQVLASCEALNPDASEADLREIAERVSGVAPGTVKIALDDHQKDGYDLQVGLRTIRCPTLLLYGDFECGSVVREQDAVEFKRLVPQATVVKIPNGNHMLWWEEAEKRRKYVQEFLRAIE